MENLKGIRKIYKKGMVKEQNIEER
ncbi:protein of unknown function [Candidatus Nitrosotalea okcheonensis]|uniref:Uncharacterized protein n=1 Tax=Candidatus Nitrosotalea okcheonensis TaxID=1903276 RepID=A0A2H1FHD2_9ARCH|nr:protein of unknown function [Candidatus Nitrosotalea okcheonensis]